MNESVEDILEEMAWGLDVRYDTSPFTSREILGFIKRIRKAIAAERTQEASRDR